MNTTRNFEAFSQLAFGIALLVLLGSPRAEAATIAFSQITSNGSQSPVAQLSAEVSDAGSQVLFKFVNASGGSSIASRISEVYWDDDPGLLSNGPLIDAGSTSGGVDLSNSPASPANVPAGNTVGFLADFSSGRRMAAANGVDPGEMAGFLFDGDATTVIDALGTGELRLGLHVISIAGDGQSESFVSHPEPASVVMVLLASMHALTVGGRSRQR